jgi:hypothetical protein
VRRFVFEDLEHEVKVTVDLPEELHAIIKRTTQSTKEAIRKLVNFTIDKEEANDTES